MDDLNLSERKKFSEENKHNRLISIKDIDLYNFDMDDPDDFTDNYSVIGFRIVLWKFSPVENANKCFEEKNENNLNSNVNYFGEDGIFVKINNKKSKLRYMMILSEDDYNLRSDVIKANSLKFSEIKYNFDQTAIKHELLKSNKDQFEIFKKRYAKYFCNKEFNVDDNIDDFYLIITYTNFDEEETKLTGIGKLFCAKLFLNIKDYTHKLIESYGEDTIEFKKSIIFNDKSKFILGNSEIANYATYADYVNSTEIMFPMTKAESDKNPERNRLLYYIEDILINSNDIDPFQNDISKFAKLLDFGIPKEFLCTFDPTNMCYEIQNIYADSRGNRFEPGIIYVSCDKY